MKLLPLVGAASLLLASACQSSGPYLNKHWSAQYIGPSMASRFLDYNVGTDGSTSEFASKQWNSVCLTLDRHFMNHNPENPFQAEAPKPAPKSNAAPSTDD